MTPSAEPADPRSRWTVTPGQRVFPGTLGRPFAVLAVDAPGGGRRFVTGNADGTLRFWDPDTVRPVDDPVPAHAFAVNTVIAVPGTGLLATASGYDETGVPDDAYRLWDAATGAPAGAVAAAEDERVEQLVALGGDRFAVLAGGRVRTSPPNGLHDIAAQGLVGVPAAGGSGPLVAVAEGAQVSFRDPGTGEPVGAPLPVAARLLAAGTAPGGGTVLVTADAEGTVQLWDPTAREPVGDPYPPGPAPLRELATVVAGDRGYLLVADDAGKVHSWDLAARTAGPTLDTDDAWIHRLAALGDGTARVAVTCSAGLVVWDCVADTSRLYPTPVAAPEAWSLAVGTVPGLGRVVAVGTDSDVDRGHDRDGGALCLYDPAGYPLREPVPIHQEGPRALAFLPTRRGPVLAVAAGAQVRFLDPGTLRPGAGPLPLRTSEYVGEYRVEGLATVRGGDTTLLAVADSDGLVRLWDPDIWRPVSDIETDHGIDGLVAVPRRTGSDLVAAALFEYGAHVWDPYTGEPVGEALEHPGRVCALAAVPAGPEGHHWVATGDEYGGIVILWEPDGRFVRQLYVRLAVTAIAGLLRRDGTPLLVVAHGGGVLAVWDGATGQRIRELVGHLEHVTQLLAVPDGPDGPEVLSAGQDGTVRRWPLAVLTG